jgi:hypothetical protein
MLPKEGSDMTEELQLKIPTSVGGIEVIANEPAPSNLPPKNGVKLYYKKIRRLLLANDETTYVCGLCGEYTSTSTFRVVAHMSKHGRGSGNGDKNMHKITPRVAPSPGDMPPHLTFNIADLVREAVATTKLDGETRSLDEVIADAERADAERADAQESASGAGLAEGWTQAPDGTLYVDDDSPSAGAEDVAAVLAYAKGPTDPIPVEVNTNGHGPVDESADYEPPTDRAPAVYAAIDELVADRDAWRTRAEEWYELHEAAKRDADALREVADGWRERAEKAERDLVELREAVRTAQAPVKKESTIPPAIVKRARSRLKLLGELTRTELRAMTSLNTPQLGELTQILIAEGSAKMTKSPNAAGPHSNLLVWVGED